MVRFAAAALALASGVLGITAHGAEIVLLDFWSPSCGPCMQMKPTVRGFVDAGWPIREVDVTRDPELARKHNVSGIPCFVMLVDNQEVDRVVGATTGERLQQMFQRAHDVERQNANRVRLQSADVAAQPPRTAGVADAPARPAVGVKEDPAQSPPAQSTEHEELLAATVRLRVQDSKENAYATGTIIDSRQGQALVITCGHLFRASEGKAPLTVEVFERVPGGIRAAGQVPAQVIHYDLERDLALVGIWPSRAVAVAPVAPDGARIERGDRVVSVGCSRGEDPTALASRITTLDRYNAPPNIEATGAPVQGRSGGGLFNDQGQLIGVCFAADYESNEGLYASLESIHAELAQNGLSEIYARVAGGPSREAPVVRGQEPLETVVPLQDTQSVPIANSAAVVTPASGAQPAPDGLNVVEQAALEEIMARAATAEVICIIRPKDPGGQSEVITLADVSPEFVRALEARKKTSQDSVIR
ncbi:MAG TPA: trypsin-like peptidase domain-containing protein [Lacipirellulaceae bacterium]